MSLFRTILAVAVWIGMAAAACAGDAVSTNSNDLYGLIGLAIAGFSFSVRNRKG